MTGPSAYIRGAGVAPVDGRRLRRVLVGLSVMVLAVLTLVLTIDAARGALTMHRLQTDGQPVQITVTSCLGLASGTGITPVGYTCRGSFTLQGHPYRAVIRGTAGLHPIGQTMAGLTAPQAPRTLFAAESVLTAPPAWRRFVWPATLFALLVLYVALIRWTRRPPPIPDSLRQP